MTNFSTPQIRPAWLEGYHDSSCRTLGPCRCAGGKHEVFSSFMRPYWTDGEGRLTQPYKYCQRGEFRTSGYRRPNGIEQSRATSLTCANASTLLPLAHSQYFPWASCPLTPIGNTWPCHASDKKDKPHTRKNFASVFLTMRPLNIGLHWEDGEKL
jgi:hypothetical protein